MKLNVIGFCVMAVLTSAGAGAAPPTSPKDGTFWVGPYYLGMSAGEARAVGITACQPFGSSSVKCKATYGPIDGVDTFTVVIGERTGKVEEIETGQRQPALQGQSTVRHQGSHQATNPGTSL